MAKRTCIFCGAPQPLTREHVIPSWLLEYVGGNEPGEFRGTRVSFLGTPLDVRKASSNSHTLGTVCGPCNHGWMSRLEHSFGAVLPRLEADMSPRRYSKLERNTIAMWIIKTGIVAHLSSNYRRILPESLALALSKGRVIPGGIKVFGGRMEATKTIQWVQSNLASSVLRSSDLRSFDALSGLAPH